MSGGAPAVPDLVVCGRIATLGDAGGLGWVEAIAIAEGRVLAGGASREVLALAGPRTRAWRLPADLVVMPGITDAHLHLASAALAATQLDLSGLDGRPAVLGAIGAEHERRAAAGDRAGWLLGHGWSLDRLGAWPSASLLDAVASGRPVALWAHDHHARWVSSAALALAAIDGSTADPRGGRVGRDTSGQPDGMLFEDAATLVDRGIPEPTHGEVVPALDAYAVELLALGVTGVHDPGEVTDDPQLRRGPTLYRALAAEGRLPLRVVGSIREAQLEAAVAAHVRTGAGVEPRDGSPGAARAAARYRDGWLKLFADGALGSRSAAMLEPYEADDPSGDPVSGPRGMLLRSRKALCSTTARAAAAGIASQIHGIGDAAVRLALDVLAGTPPVGGACHRVEHAQLVHPDDVPRFVRLGIAASVQPCHLVSDAVSAHAAWGERTAGAFPLASLDRTGALLPFGTDAPVEPADPWRGIAAAVTRSSGEWPPEAGPFHAEQAVPPWRALRAACSDGPRSLGITDEGSLRPGDRADLLVVPAAIVDEAPHPGGALETCRPLATLVDGEVVWRSPAFDP